MLKKDGIYFAYLRKSREDHDAELNGAEDTLARHEYIINDMASRFGIQISRWYREVVSGETIADRPQMLNLLSDVERTHPNGVLVVEVERLSRGNPQDQGRVMDTFKYSNTLIVTPMKIYDLTKENDEEWIDFGLLRSRMEYRTIKRRLQNGRTTSAMQGKFIGNAAPYGWMREKLKGEKGYTLIPNPDTSWVLHLMYELLYSGTIDTDFIPVGITTVARILDRKGIAAPKGDKWDACSISRIVQNPVNIGMVRIGWRKEVSTIVDGERRRSRPINKDAILVPARWKGQISKDIFDSVCAKLSKHATVDTFKNISNPLAGIIKCSVCGRTMVRRPSGNNPDKAILMCRTYQCACVGSYFNLIEDRLISSLESYLSAYQLHVNSNSGYDWESAIEVKKTNLKELHANRERLEQQYSKVCSLFEQDIYDLDTYLARSRNLKNELSSVQQSIADTSSEISRLEKQSSESASLVPYFESVLDSYKKSDDPKYKNILLKEIVTDVVYTKTSRGKRSGDGIEAFDLDIHVNLMAHPKNLN